MRAKFTVSLTIGVFQNKRFKLFVLYNQFVNGLNRWRILEKDQCIQTNFQ
jgi:hypothetical protein